MSCISKTNPLAITPITIAFTIACRHKKNTLPDKEVLSDNAVSVSAKVLFKVGDTGIAVVFECLLIYCITVFCAAKLFYIECIYS